MPELVIAASDLAADLAILVSAVRKAGAVARSFFGAEYKRWHKTKGDPVTEVDIAIDRLLQSELMAVRPHYGWLSEESVDDPRRLQRERVWIIDPIDGTRAFVKGRSQFAVCAALAVGGQAFAGVVFNPMTDELFAASLGGGATCNGKVIRVSRRDTLEGCRMLGSKDLFHHPAWKRPWPPMEIETRNSIAYRMGLVAAGAWDGCLALTGKSDWDLAAADIIVREAGGLVSDHTGAPFCYNRERTRHPSLIAAGPVLHALIHERVAHIRLDATH